MVNGIQNKCDPGRYLRCHSLTGCYCGGQGDKETAEEAEGIPAVMADQEKAVYEDHEDF